MVKVYLALGSNVGDSKANISKATELLGNSVNSIVRAPLYSSKAVGYTDQPDFINTVIAGETDLTPEDLLVFIKSVEKKVGRIQRFRWGPREIDIDIIFYSDLVFEKENLTIPHARFRERDFVLRPLNDLNPDFLDPISKKTISQLMDNLPKKELSIFNRLD